MPALSIVVPTYNRWDRLQRVLKALSEQTVPREDLEVVVVSDGSTDETDKNLAAGNSPVPVHFIQQENSGPAVARNTGVAKASGDLILFIDDDVVAAPECAAVHLESHEKATRDTVVIGPLLTPDGDHKLEPWVAWEQRMLYKQYDAMARGDWAPTARQFYTGNASLARATMIASGGFDASFKRGEDVQLAYRLRDEGMVFAFEATARAFHHAERSYQSWLSNASSYGRNDVLMWRDYGQDWLIPTVRAEYHNRSRLTQVYTRLGLKAPGVVRADRDVVPRLALAGERLGIGKLVQGALSATYNLAYYQGLVKEIGGFADFMAIEPVPLVDSPDPDQV